MVRHGFVLLWYLHLDCSGDIRALPRCSPEDQQTRRQSSERPGSCIYPLDAWHSLFLVMTAAYTSFATLPLADNYANILSWGKGCKHADSLVPQVPKSDRAS